MIKTHESIKSLTSLRIRLNFKADTDSKHLRWLSMEFQILTIL